MALPKTYLTTQKNLDGILAAIQTARAPSKFTQQFLAGLGFKSSSDRLIIGVLKSLGFLSPAGEPTQRYFEFLDQTQAPRVMAEALQEAYEDLYEVNTNAHTLPRNDLKNKMRTLSQGQFSDAVLDKMTMTFQALAKHADFEAAEESARAGRQAVPMPNGDEAEVDGDGAKPDGEGAPEPELSSPPPAPPSAPPNGGAEGGGGDRAFRGGPQIDGLVYNIQIQLPESRDPAVYDALFRSLKTHLLQ